MLAQTTRHHTERDQLPEFFLGKEIGNMSKHCVVESGQTDWATCIFFATKMNRTLRSCVYYQNIKILSALAKPISFLDGWTYHLIEGRQSLLKAGCKLQLLAHGEGRGGL